MSYARNLFFVPYYFLAVLSFFTHIGCELGKYIAKGQNLQVAYRFVYIFMGIGAIAAVVILLAFSGMLYEFELPRIYRELYP